MISLEVWVGYGITFSILLGLLWYYLKVKSVMNKALEIATHDFDQAVHSLLKTPEELPDPILDFVEAMGDIAFRRGLPRQLAFYALSNGRKKTSTNLSTSTNRSNEVNEAVDLMREELQELFTKAAAAWIRIISLRSPFAGPLIIVSLANVTAKRGRISDDSSDDAVDLMRGLNNQVA